MIRLSICVIAVLSASLFGGCKTSHQQVHELKDQMVARNREATGHFPSVTIGMSLQELEQRIAEVDPPKVNKYGLTTRNISVQNRAVYRNSEAITYRVGKGYDYSTSGRMTARYEYVVVNVENGRVTGYSR